MTKKIISLVLAVIMLFSVTAGMNFTAFAIDASGKCGDSATYKFNKSTGTLTISGTGAIADKAFSEIQYDEDVPCDTTIKKVIINSGITEIGDGSFAYCSVLQSVSIPNTVTKIGYCAFDECYELTSVTIPNSVEAIGDCAFSECDKLIEVKIGTGLKNIDYSTFSDCYSLSKITVDGNNPYLDSRDNCNAIIDSKNNKLIVACSNSTIPESVTEIGDYAFCAKYNKSDLVISDNVKKIGVGAFSNSQALKNVVLGKNVSTISKYAFYHCDNIVNIDLGDKVKSIGESAFSGCKALKSIKFPASLISIGKSAFVDCKKLTKITIPDSVTKIGRDAFYACKGLKTVVLGNGITTINEWTFAYCYELKNLTLPESLTLIKARAFTACNGLQQVVLPDSVERIENGVFCDCANLSSIVISKSVSFINYYTFEYCDLLTNVYYKGSKTDWENITIDDKNLSNVNIHYNFKPCQTHSNAESVKEINYEETCGSNGSYSNVIYCSKCGYELSRENIIVPATGKHKFKTKGRVVSAPTSSNTGIMLYDCENCCEVKCKTIPKLKKTSISKLTAKSKGFKVSWKKISSESGYQIQYSTSSKFKNAKSFRVTKTSTTSRSVSKLKAKKKYYVRVRTYRTINGKKYYSAWSKYKSVKTK